MDHLIGLKENVLIGKLIPAGTGMKRYRSVKLDSELDMDDEILFDDEEEEEDIQDMAPLEEEMMEEAEEVLDMDDLEETVEEV